MALRLAGEETDFSVWKVSEFILRDPLAKKGFLHWVSDYVIAPERLGQWEGYWGPLATVQAADRHGGTQPRRVGGVAAWVVAAGAFQ